MFKVQVRSFSVSRLVNSLHRIPNRKTLREIRDLYEKEVPISIVTAWDAITGYAAEEAQIDVVLVGDSLAMVALGCDDTVSLELTDMIHHVKAVSRGNKTSFLVADLPFGHSEESQDQAVRSSIALLKKGKAQAVKIEGGEEIAPTIKRIVQAGVPVMGHIGLLPQKHNTTGGFRVQGKTIDSAIQILKDCKALEEAGVFAMVVECVPNRLAELITKSISVPTIGIGAGNAVSGQVLVTSDLLGMDDKRPAKFVKTYMNFFEQATQALAAYKKDVTSGTFPDPDEHGYKINSQVLAELKNYIASKETKSK